MHTTVGALAALAVAIGAIGAPGTGAFAASAAGSRESAPPGAAPLRAPAAEVVAAPAAGGRSVQPGGRQVSWWWDGSADVAPAAALARSWSHGVARHVGPIVSAITTSSTVTPSAPMKSGVSSAGIATAIVPVPAAAAASAAVGR